ncbi:SulP family inorganic anion transporter [Methylobacillus gramineus]|uniref:SulP family inorganic anion transporter n=1 Tax=Methylobacillus gramineus TaxID=755169 RepID=UPI001D000C41|nr:SulP family inorganic anion transporter [Methylobacillus gramineus]MCB5184854.1 SulP family inorganic anion transporter [Methylobacillus gramineus]
MTSQTVAPSVPKGSFSKDFFASIVVFLVAVPLCLGIAIASGLPPTAGIITGIIGGLIVGSISGSPLTVSGPAAGLVVIVADIVAEYGIAIYGMIVLLAGLVQVLAGVFKLGVWFRAISPAVIHGMLGGIGVLIIGSQFHIMLDRDPLSNGIKNLMDIPNALIETFEVHGGNIYAASIGLLTITSIVLWTKYAPTKLKLIPGALIGVVLSVIVANLFNFDIKYLTDLFDGPTNLQNILGTIVTPTLGIAQSSMTGGVIVAVLSLAFIASAESLLSCAAVDQMHQGARTKYDKELMAQGIGNTICGFLSALPMTGVIVRSSANVEAGATSRASTIMHGLWLLLFISVFLFTLEYIPVATLAAVLVYTGYKLAYPKVAKQLLVYGKPELAIYIITIITIVSFNLLAGVITGLALSIAKLLYVFAHVSIKAEHQAANKTILHLKGSATLLGIPKLVAVLDKLETGRDIHVQFEHLEYIDHACIELLNGWQKQYELTGGKVTIEWDSLISKYHSKEDAAIQGS